MFIFFFYSKGFERVFSEMSDIVIDVPAAYTVLDRIFEKCLKEGNFLPEKVRVEVVLYNIDNKNNHSNKP